MKLRRYFPNLIEILALLEVLMIVLAKVEDATDGTFDWGLVHPCDEGYGEQHSDDFR
jgi:hypothetical protein